MHRSNGLFTLVNLNNLFGRDIFSCLMRDGNSIRFQPIRYDFIEPKFKPVPIQNNYSEEIKVASS